MITFVSGDIYLDFTSGSDTNSGTTSSTPVKTLQKATTLCPNNGTISILPNHYNVTGSYSTAWDGFTNSNKTVNINDNNSTLLVNVTSLNHANFIAFYGTTSATVNLTNLNIINTGTYGYHVFEIGATDTNGGGNAYNLAPASTLNLSGVNVYSENSLLVLLYTNSSTEISNINSNCSFYGPSGYTSYIIYSNHGTNNINNSFTVSTAADNISDSTVNGTSNINVVPQITENQFKALIGY